MCWLFPGVSRFLDLFFSNSVCKDAHERHFVRTLDGERLGRRLGSGGPALTIQDIQARDSVRGLERLSLCDWPGRMSAVLFFGGCNSARLHHYYNPTWP